MRFIRDDGGRAAAGFRGMAGDCVVRAIAIATGIPYIEIYRSVNRMAKCERKGSRKRGISSARDGVYRLTQRRYMDSIGWKWVPTMGIGTGCKVHLRESELPMGSLVVAVSCHMTAVVDGVIRDNHDCGRDGNRCVYGYWRRGDDHEA